MLNNFPDIGYFPKPPKGDRPLTVGNLLKLDKLVQDREGKVGKLSLYGMVSAYRALKGSLEDPPSSSQEAVIASDEGDRDLTESEWEDDEIEPPSSPAVSSANNTKNVFKETRRRKRKLKVVQLTSRGTIGSKVAERSQQRLDIFFRDPASPFWVSE